jgi:hypothetical protein
MVACLQYRYPKIVMYNFNDEIKIIENLFYEWICFPNFLNDFCAMLKKLQEKWKVGIGSLVLIITTFALGGSLCGYLGRKLLGFTSMEKGVLWVVAYVLLVTILWPLCVIVISIPLGQFVFFKNYLRKVFARISGRRK